jgi:hypothetical protein
MIDDDTDDEVMIIWCDDVCKKYSVTKLNLYTLTYKTTIVYMLKQIIRKRQI